MLQTASDAAIRDARAARAPGNPAATAAPSALGAFAGALLAFEVEKILAGEFADALVGRELLCGVGRHSWTLTALGRNPDCRFDHRPSRPEFVDDQPLGPLLAAAGTGATLGVERDAFAQALRCQSCGHTQAPFYRLVRRLAPSELRCPRCTALREITGFERIHALERERLPSEILLRRLSELGLRAGDFFHTSGSAGERDYELAAPGADACAPLPRRSVAQIGCGAIGSEAVAHLARLPGLERLVLIDPDAFESSNLAGQRIRQRDLGVPKVEVLAERARELAPGLEVEAFCARIEDLPPGRLRGVVLAAGLDTRAARQYTNELACRLGAYYVDAAVDARERIARIRTYKPEPTTACFECSFTPAIYAALEQEYPCDVTLTSAGSSAP